MTDSNDVLTIKLKSSITLDNVSAFYNELAENKDSSPAKLVLDCALNEQIDFAGVQTLTAFYKLMASKGSKISWDNPSIALFERSVELGMDEDLGL